VLDCHVYDSEECYHPGRDAVQHGRLLLTFSTNTLPLVFSLNIKKCRLILAGCLRDLNFYTEDGGGMFLRNVGNLYQTTVYHIAGDSTRHSDRYESLKPIIHICGLLQDISNSEQSPTLDI
jgi:hypothetical protein